MPVADIYRTRATPQDIIRRALRVLNALAAGESLPADLLDDGREALNDLLDAWNIEKLALYVLARNTFTLTSGQNPHTIGPAANLDAPRPNRIEQGQAFLSGGALGTSEVPLLIVDREAFARIVDKTVSGQPGLLYYETAMPLGNVYLYPRPDAAYSLILYLERLFAQIQSNETSTELILPPGYKEALVHNLAVRLAPEMGRSVPAEVAVAALQSKSELKRLNQQSLALRGDPALLGEAQKSTGMADRLAFLTGGL